MINQNLLINLIPLLLYIPFSKTLFSSDYLIASIFAFTCYFLSSALNKFLYLKYCFVFAICFIAFLEKNIFLFIPFFIIPYYNLYVIKTESQKSFEI